jgi:hypothetical protein
MAIALSIGIETGMEGRCVAWALEHPGCFAYGASGDQALGAAPRAFFEYATWVNNRSGEESWISTDDVELVLEDTWECYHINDTYQLAEDGYEVNAWFRHDWKPLSEEEVGRGLTLLEWSRADLLDLLSEVSEAAMHAKLPGERWDIEGILRHLAGAEWWYLDRLGLAVPRREIPRETFERLKRVRLDLRDRLPRMIESKQVVGVDFEFWSPRKLLRRAVWHERDHTTHIRRLAGMLA